MSNKTTRVTNYKPKQNKTQNRTSSKQSQFCKHQRGENMLNLTLVADSQGRDIIKYLHMDMGDNASVFGHVQPGAKLQNVLDALLSSDKNNPDCKENEWVVIMAGCNDVNDGNSLHLTDKFKNLLEEKVLQLQQKNIIVATLPYRYDLQCHSRTHKIIADINTEIRQLTERYTNVYLLDLYLLERWCHTAHGLHINKKGKQRVSKMIRKTVLEVGEKIQNQLQKNISTTASTYQHYTPVLQHEKLEELDSTMNSNSTTPFDISNPFFGFSPISLPENALRESTLKSSLDGKKADTTTDHFNMEFCAASLNDFPTLPQVLNDSVQDVFVNNSIMSIDSLSVKNHDFLG